MKKLGILGFAVVVVGFTSSKTQADDLQKIASFLQQGQKSPAVLNRQPSTTPRIRTDLFKSPNTGSSNRFKAPSNNSNVFKPQNGNKFQPRPADSGWKNLQNLIRNSKNNQNSNAKGPANMQTPGSKWKLPNNNGNVFSPRDFVPNGKPNLGGIGGLKIPNGGGDPLPPGNGNLGNGNGNGGNGNGGNAGGGNAGNGNGGNNPAPQNGGNGNSSVDDAAKIIGGITGLIGALQGQNNNPYPQHDPNHNHHPHPGGQVHPGPQGQWNPGNGYPPGNSLPGNPLPSPAWKITIMNPEANQSSVRFVMGGETAELKPGYFVSVEVTQKTLIEFDRGGSFGSARYSLKDGMYRFDVDSSKGWELFKVKQDTATASNP